MSEVHHGSTREIMKANNPSPKTKYAPMRKGVAGEVHGLRAREASVERILQKQEELNRFRQYITSRPEQEFHSVSKRMTYLHQTKQQRPTKQINAVRGSVSEILRMRRTMAASKPAGGTFS